MPETTEKTTQPINETEHAQKEIQENPRTEAEIVLLPQIETEPEKDKPEQTLESQQKKIIAEQAAIPETENKETRIAAETRLQQKPDYQKRYHQETEYRVKLGNQ